MSFILKFVYPDIFSFSSARIVNTGWSRGHHIVCTQLWWWGKANTSITCRYFTGNLLDVLLSTRSRVFSIYISALCPTTAAGDSQQGSAAEAVGLEASSVHSFLEGHSHCACSQHDLWLHLYTPRHRSVITGLMAVNSINGYFTVERVSPFHCPAGGCDGTIKLWDVVKQYCTHNLKGSSGVVQ